MKKYLEQISIVDEAGNHIHTHEREIAADNVIERLLTGIVAVASGPQIKVTPKRLKETILNVKKVMDGTRPEAKVGGRYTEKRRMSGHDCCGSKGARHMKGCTSAGTSYKPGYQSVQEEIKGETPQIAFGAPRDGALGGIDFLKLKDLQATGTPSMVIASKLRTNIREVGTAMNSDTHSEYLSKRNKQ